MNKSVTRWLSLLACSLLGCGDGCAPDVTPPDATPTASASAVSASGPPGRVLDELASHEGSAVTRDPASQFLVVADEDHDALRVIALPMSADSKVATLAMPGPPAQLVTLEDRVLVTIREPPLLMAWSTSGSTDPTRWKEAFRVSLPTDVWGLAVDRARATAYVSSAWAHHVSAIDLVSHAVRWSADVAREPRGLAIVGDDVYVNHLVGSEITRISAVATKSPSIERIALPPAPLRTPLGVEPGAALGYTLMASPDGRRLFVPRHAIGVVGEWNWYGAMTIDVLNVPDRKALLDKPKPRRFTHAADFPDSMDDAQRFKSYWHHVSRVTTETEVAGGPTVMGSSNGRQPRHAVYRKQTDTILVASEGQNALIEYDALAPAPAVFAMFEYKLGYQEKPVWEHPVRAGAPSGIVLSADEATAYVYCRSTDDVVATRLVVERHRPRPSGAAAAPEEDLGEPVVLRLVDDKAHADPADPKVELFQMGRAAYYQAASSRVGLGVACATCHPDGRDDGFVWREMQFPDEKGDRSLLMSDPTLAEAATKDGANNWGRKVRPLTDPLGAARQTPMLAGRVGRRGPYGWRGESETLADRVAHGMSLHRTSDASDHGYSKGELGYYAAAIAMFLREGLHVPARADRPLSEQETRGRTLFGSPEVGCVDCHKPDTDYTDGTGYPDIVRTTERYRDEPKLLFRTPSLRFVSGTAPYMHDGSRKTLLGVIEQSGDKMGKTAHLSGEDKRALVAFLETL